MYILTQTGNYSFPTDYKSVYGAYDTLDKALHAMYFLVL